ncbi:MAG: hypothetical protein QOG48_2069 [Verrucomicrobiota bacterium]
MKTLCSISFLLLAIVSAPGAEAFLGPIPVQYVAPDKELVLDMHRFYQPAGKPDLQFTTKDDVDLAFDAASLQLRARVHGRGLFDVALRDRTAASILTIATEAGSSAHHFVFKPTDRRTKVFLAGSFNGWSADKTPMTGPNEAGEYVVDLALAPGRCSYKFVVDGKWVRDPANSETEDNGMGDKNSVVTVAAENKTEGPTIYADELGGNELSIRAASTISIVRVSAVLESEMASNSISAKIDNGKIDIEVPEKRVGFVRVIAAANNGNPTNVMRVAIGGTTSVSFPNFARDRARPSNFHWQDAVMYYAFTDRFSDGDKSNDKPVDDANVLPPANFHGGDLRGVREKIDNGYFESLGVNTVWVAPLNRNPAKAYREYPEPHRWYTGYHGYWPVSSTDIDPHIGTDKDLHALVDDAHKHGMKVIADLVLHHVHEEHPWWKEHRDWFGSLDLPDGKKNLRLWDEQQFTTWFEPYLPSFDFAKDAPVHALIDNSIWWLNTYKLDGFRLDAVKHILPSFWWKFRAALREKAKQPFYLVGETFKDRQGIDQFVGPNMLDGQFDFPLYDQIKDTFALTKGDFKALDDALTSSEKTYGKETLMSPLIGNHDKGRFMAYADGDLPDPKIDKEEEVGWEKPPKIDDADNYKKLELAQAFLMSIDGVPMIYYGDEFGMTGAGDPDNRRDMRFGDQLSPNEQRVLENFKKLGAIRKAHPALRGGSRRTVQCDHDVYAFVRAYLDDRVAVIFNRGKTEAKIDIEVSPEMGDGDYNDGFNIADGRLQGTIPAQTARFIAKAK